MAKFVLEYNGTLEKVADGVFQYTFRYDHLNVNEYYFLSRGLYLPTSLENAADKRQIDYLSGRYCVKKIYEYLGLDLPLPAIDEDKGPVWPKGYQGSISHTEGFATAVVSEVSDIVVGVDLETVTERIKNLKKHICVDMAEFICLKKVILLSDEEILTIIFSAKESLFKALYPKVNKFFGFKAARVVSSSEGNSIKIILQEDLYPSSERMPRPKFGRG